MIRPEVTGRKLRMRDVCGRYGISSKTIDRWLEAGILPEPMVINNVRYWDESELDQRDQERMAEARQNHASAQAGDAA